MKNIELLNKLTFILEENAKYKENLEAANRMLSIQGNDGTWDYDPYLHGMYNGMEFIISLVEERSPIYREAPSSWGKDKLDNEKLNEEIHATSAR